MELKPLFELIDGILGDIATFQGLQFGLKHGLIVIDFVTGYEYQLENGSTDIVDGYIIDFIPFDELQSPDTYFALDEEGLKYIISEFILE